MSDTPSNTSLCGRALLAFRAPVGHLAVGRAGVEVHVRIAELLGVLVGAVRVECDVSAGQDRHVDGCIGVKLERRVPGENVVAEVGLGVEVVERITLDVLGSRSSRVLVLPCSGLAWP